jgi:hypothetical protein
LVFAELAERRDVWHEALKEWNVKQSQQVLEWQEEARKEAAADQKRADVLRALQLRYRVPVPPDMAATLQQTRDLAELSRWFDAVLLNDTLEALRTALGQSAGLANAQ